MKISKIDLTTYKFSDNLLQISCDEEASQSILAHIVKIQETHNKLLKENENLKALLKEASKFVDSELKQSIEDLNNFERRVK